MAPPAVHAKRPDSYKNFTLRLRDGNRTYSGWAQKHPGTIGSNLPKFAEEVKAVRECVALWVAATDTRPAPA